ncbi:MAG: T9SS type A sorting domain-containing protein [Candidatus Kapaibacterium sp.]
MKALFLFFSFIIVGTLQAQYTDPPSITRLHGVYARWQNVQTNNWYADTVQANFSDTSVYCFDHKIFALGSQWGVPTRSLAKRIHHRFFNEKWSGHPFDTAMVHIPRNSGRQYFSSNNNTMLFYNFSVAHRWSPGIAPPLRFNGVDWDFSPPADDTNGLVYGFWHREGGTVMPNYSYKLMADSAVGYGNNGRLVLSQPVNNLWKNGGIPFYSETDASTHKDVIARNGRHWYFSITLNRSDAFYNDSTAADDTVLTIKIPIRYIRTINSIKDTLFQALQFDSILQVGTQTANIQYHSRGGFMDTRLVYGSDSILTIRRSMLPKFSDTSLITLSGYFICPLRRDSLPGHPNPSFPPNSNTKGEIDSLNVEIYYHGKCNITIRDCMIGTQMSRWVFRGERDTIIAGLMTAHDIRPFFSLRDSCPDLRFWRFYGLDETTYPHWLYHRYLSKLFEQNFTTEGPADYIYEHIVPQKDYWRGSTSSQVRQFKPFVGRFLYNEPATTHLGMAGGIFRPVIPPYPSKYYGNNYDFNTEKKLYNNIAEAKGMSHHTLDVYEGLARQLYYTPGTLYSKKPFYYNIHKMQQWRVAKYPGTSQPYLYVEFNGQQTSEEYRSVLWLGVLHGAKGFMYDRFNAGSIKYLKSDSLHADYFDPSQNKMDCGLSGYQINIPNSWIRSENPADGDRSIYANGMGSDFLYANHPTKLDSYINNSVTPPFFYIQPERMYFGLRSIRHEMRKTHDILERIGDTLVKLQLFAMFSKGLNTYQSAASGNPNDIKQYISIDSIKLVTQSFNDSIPDTWAMRHFDIAIHKHSNIPMTEEFYIAVFNRRTSPLLTLPASHRPSFAYPFYDSLTFYSGYEFDSLTTDFTNTLSSGDKAFWQQQRYKQGGARMITLPFNVKASDNHYALLRVTELGADDPYLDSVYNYRNNPALYQKIDTVIGQDRSVMVKLLPGEGKIFRVRVLPTDPSVTGNLAHSNQRKLISFPVPVYDSVKGYYVPSADSVRYHLCYFRPISTSDKRTVVCYRRSKSTARNSPYANLVWENEVILSNSYSHPPRTIQNDTCAYPSLVARYDTVSGQTYCYVVYGCKGYMPQPPLTGIQEPFQRIVESKIWHINATPWHYAYILADSVYTNNLAEFGTPMIAASEQNALGGNFYAWGDRKRGIGVGWHRSQYNSLESKRYIRFHSDTSECFSLWKAQHPSLSTYIPLRHKGHDCALVWQENYSCDDIRSEIFTTRLRANGLTVEPYLGPEFMTVGNFAYFNADSSIYCLSNATGIMKDTIHLGNTMAMPWREQSLRHTCTIEPLSQAARIRLDAIVWEKRLPSIVFPVFGYGLLVLDGLAHYDTLIGTTLQPLRTQALSKTLISHFPYGWMYRPSLSQGHATMSDESFTPNALGCVNSNAKSLIINAVETNEAALPGGGTTWLPVYFHRELSHSIFAQLQTKQYVSSTSSNPYIHLAGIPFALTPTQRWEHRRVYSYHPTSSTALPQILGSAQYFYKLSDRFISRVYHGWKDADGYVAISAPHINGHELEWNIQDRTMSIAHDTLITSWFRINDEALLQQKIKTDGWDALQVSIQKQGEQPQRLPLSLQRDPLGLGVMHTIEFSQGDNNFYRLLYTRGTVSEFQREICTEMEDNGLSKKTSTTINLSQLGHNNRTFAVYPNPANDELSVVWSGGKATVELLDSQGLTVFSAPMTTSVTLSTKELSSGVYMVRLKQGLHTQSMSVIVLH